MFVILLADDSADTGMNPVQVTIVLNSLDELGRTLP
jgi:hypothetical protein